MFLPHFLSHGLRSLFLPLKAEQKKQGIAPAGFSIRERVEGRLEELENEVEQLRYESACFTIRSKENESSACQMLSWEEKKNLLLLYFDDILVTVQWLVHIYAPIALITRSSSKLMVTIAPSSSPIGIRKDFSSSMSVPFSVA